MNTLQPGDAIPPFTTVDQDENIVRSTDMARKKKASYFFIQRPIRLAVRLRLVT